MSSIGKMKTKLKKINRNVSENLLQNSDSEDKYDDDLKNIFAEDKSSNMKYKQGPPSLEPYNRSIKRDYKVIQKIPLPPKKKLKENAINSESEDFDLIEHNNNLETDLLSALYTKHPNKEITKDGAPFDKG